MAHRDNDHPPSSGRGHRGAAVMALAILLALAALPWIPASAGDDDEMRIREGILDEIVLKTLKAPEGAGVIVRRFSSDRADLGTAEKGDHQRRLDAVNLMKREGPRVLAEQIVSVLEVGGAYSFAREAEGDSLPEDSIVVEGRFTKINPGSRAKRWTMFAGQTAVEVEGTVKDSGGNVLAEFRHMRKSGVGIAGGDYVKFLMDDTRDVGSDVALFLKRWATGGDLSQD